MSHIEIVQTDAEQPWHGRVKAGNGQIVWHTENYAEHDSAASAVAVVAEAFGIQMSRPPQPGDPEVDGIGYLGEAPTGNVYCFDVREVDERTPTEEPEPPADPPAEEPQP
jgi:uncharacterized protein YegP (UPF0339 family)